LLRIELVTSAIGKDSNGRGLFIMRQLSSIPFHLLFVGVVWGSLLNTSLPFLISLSLGLAASAVAGTLITTVVQDV
jgi:hypothetical protein